MGAASLLGTGTAGMGAAGYGLGGVPGGFGPGGYGGPPGTIVISDPPPNGMQYATDADGNPMYDEFGNPILMTPDQIATRDATEDFLQYKGKFGPTSEEEEGPEQTNNSEGYYNNSEGYYNNSA